MESESKDSQMMAAYDEPPIDEKVPRHYSRPTLAKIAVNQNTDGKASPVSPESKIAAPS